MRSVLPVSGLAWPSYMLRPHYAIEVAIPKTAGRRDDAYPDGPGTLVAGTTARMRDGKFSRKFSRAYLPVGNLGSFVPW